MRNKYPRLEAADKGQVLITAALSLIALLGFAGLAIDAGALRYERRLQQTAADAAAIAGANELQQKPGGGNMGNPVAAALCASATNNFIDSNSGIVAGQPCSPTTNGAASRCTHAAVGTVCVQVNNPTDSTFGAKHSGANYVEVIVAAVQPTYFMKVFGITKSVVSARALATLVNQKGGSKPGCIYSLDPNSDKSVWVSGGTTVQATHCGVSDNGGFTADSNGSLTAGSIGVVGTINGSATPLPSPQVTMPNPLAYLTPPSSCTNLGKVSISGGQVVSFASGTYCVTDFSVSSNNAVVCNKGNTTLGLNGKTVGDCSSAAPANNGVTFYVTGTLNITGGTIELSAPTSGAYAGVLFYQSATDTNGALLTGNNGSSYNGALYFPGATLDFQGTSGATVNACTTMVANDIKFGGGSTININSDPSCLASPPGGALVANAVLVE